MSTITTSTIIDNIMKSIKATIKETDYKASEFIHDEKTDTFCVDLVNNKSYNDAYLDAHSPYIDTIDKRTQEAKWCMHQADLITRQIKDVLLMGEDKKTLDELNNRYKTLLLCAGNHEKEIAKLEKNKTPITIKYDHGNTIRLEIKRTDIINEGTTKKHHIQSFK